MAKHKKAYAGTEEHHKAAALDFAKSARRHLRDLPAALRAGDCHQALAILGAAREMEGSYLAHRSEVKRGKYGAEYAIFKQTAKAMNAFRKVCVKK